MVEKYLETIKARRAMHFDIASGTPRQGHTKWSTYIPHNITCIYIPPEKMSSVVNKVITMLYGMPIKNPMFMQMLMILYTRNGLSPKDIHLLIGIGVTRTIEILLKKAKDGGYIVIMGGKLEKKVYITEKGLRYLLKYGFFPLIKYTMVYDYKIQFGKNITHAKHLKEMKRFME